MGLLLKAAPTIEPVGLEDFKEYARIDPSITAFDTTLLNGLVEARKAAEVFQRRAYITQTWEYWLDYWPCFPVDIPLPPLQSIGSIEYYGIDDAKYTFDDDYYFVDTANQPGRIGLNYNVSLPSMTLRPTNGVCITFDAGYGDDAIDVPETVTNAINLYALWRYENPESGDVPTAFKRALWPDRMVRV
jgi:uncharacterized phiE125 gp8 family phage protein